MAAGLPVVATEVGGLSEVVKHGETGWLVPPKDVAALADCISQLLGDDARCATFGRAGRKLVESQFAVADMVRRHEEVFLQLLQGGDGWRRCCH
jgi:glycosyltransferase involved in cell wall biosynthesis